MGYSEITCSNLCGVKALSKLSFDLLNKKERRGLIYLRKSLNLLKQVLKYNEISCEIADKAFMSVSIISITTKEIPFAPLAELSKSLSAISSLSDLSQHLGAFVSNKEIKKANAFKIMSGSNRVLFEKITIIIAVITAIGTGIQAILPENIKGEITGFLVSTTTPVFITFVITILFLIMLMRLTIKIGNAFIVKSDLSKAN
jgi:hypothetical protein